MNDKAFNNYSVYDPVVIARAICRVCRSLYKTVNRPLGVIKKTPL